MRFFGVKQYSILFYLFNLLFLINTFVPNDILRKFEYKLSFKGPHLVFKDGTIPFWEYSGSAIASNDQIRITPSIKSQKGRIWSKNAMTNENWEVEVALRINGRGRIGADGMAIWYTEKAGTEGPVFGSNDHWKGLGVFLDSFDNDAQQNNPYILIMTNDGTKTYDHHRDGITQQLGGCLRDFRNKPFPIRLKIEYYKRALTVYYNGGVSNEVTSWEICSRVENVDLPKNGHFGVTAETGGLADDHDCLYFVTHSLTDRTTPEVSTPSTDEQKKYDKEYEEFLKQLELEKERYKKDHPEKAEEEIDDKKNYEVESDRQFRIVLDVQNSIHQSIRLLDNKIAEILGRQERVVSMLTTINNNQQNQQLSKGQSADTFKREEVVQVMTQQNELVKSLRDLQVSLNEMHKKTNNIQESLKHPVAAPSPIDPSMMQQLNDGLKNIRFDIANNMNLMKNQAKCPESPSCLSTTYFMAIIIAQTVLFVGYFIYKSRSESQLKKFY